MASMDLAAMREGRCPFVGCPNPAVVHGRTATVCEQHAADLLGDRWRQEFRRAGAEWFPPDPTPRIAMAEPGVKAKVAKR